MNKKIILASKSPRRKELLSGFLSDFEIIPDTSEELIDYTVPPEEAVRRLAVFKATNVAAKTEENALVIAADTVVFIDGVIMGKPGSKQEAKEMLLKLSGRDHHVCTGIAVMDTESGKIASDFERTAVHFRYISDDEINKYIETNEPMDKAGAYGIQGIGALFVEGIKGDYFNIVGLPLQKLSQLLEKEFDFYLF